MKKPCKKRIKNRECPVCRGRFPDTEGYFYECSECERIICSENCYVACFFSSPERQHEPTCPECFHEIRKNHPYPFSFSICRECAGLLSKLLSRLDGVEIQIREKEQGFSRESGEKSPLDKQGKRRKE